MAMTIHVDIVSAEKEIFSGLAEMVFAPAELGEVGISARHAPLISKLNPGEVRVKVSDTETQEFFVSGGLLEVQPHLVTVLADTAIRAKDIDEAAALYLDYWRLLANRLWGQLLSRLVELRLGYVRT